VKLLISIAIVIFLISFILLFVFFHKENKLESEEEKSSFIMMIVMAILFSLIITIASGLFFLAVIGSTSIVNTVFSLDISLNQLVILSLAFLAYIFILDDIVEFIFEFLVRKKIIVLMILALVRIIAFYWIGLLNGLNQNVSFTLAIGVTLIIFVIESLNNMREKSKQAN
jgi:hypothetical protein